MKEKQLVLGTTSSTSNNKIKIPYAKRDTHMHVVGTTGQGKSRFLQKLIEQDIIFDQGFCLIDPHGELYDSLLRVAAHDPLLTYGKPVRFINLCDPNWIFNFNPLHTNASHEVPWVAGAVAEAITRVYGGRDSRETPLLRDTMFKVCCILAERKLPLAAAKLFFYPKYFSERDRLINKIELENVRDLSEQLQDLKDTEYREVISSTDRRISELWAFPALQNIFSQTRNPIDLTQAMDEGEMLILNLRPQNKMYDLSSAKLIGIMLVNFFVGAAFNRDPLSNPKPFHLYIDEIQNFISKDILDILSQTRKFGLFLTLSHQYFSQLETAGDDIPEGVHDNTPLKAYFKMNSKSAYAVVDDIFGHEIDLNKVKDIATPTVTGHELGKFKTKGQSDTDTDTRGAIDSEAVGEASGGNIVSGKTVMSGDAAGAALSITGMPDGGVELMTTSIDSQIKTSNTANTDFEGYNYNNSYVKAKAESVANSNAHTESTSESEGLIPIIELLKTQALSLEDQRFQLARRLFNLNPREGYLYASGFGTIPFYTLAAEIPLVPPSVLKTFIENNAGKYQHVTATTDADLDLLQLVKEERGDDDFLPEEDLDYE